MSDARPKIKRRQPRKWRVYNPTADLREWQFRRKLQCVEYKGGACARCKGVFPVVCYDFHHLDRSTKSFDISGARLKKTWPRLQAELDKCILLCANCHRIEEVHDETMPGCSPTGSWRRRTRLTEEQVQFIRDNPDGLKGADLARKLGVSPSTISYIKSGRRWKGDPLIDAVVPWYQRTHEKAPATGS